MCVRREGASASSLLHLGHLKVVFELDDCDDDCDDDDDDDDDDDNFAAFTALAP